MIKKMTHRRGTKLTALRGFQSFQTFQSLQTSKLKLTAETLSTPSSEKFPIRNSKSEILLCDLCTTMPKKFRGFRKLSGAPILNC